MIKFAFIPFDPLCMQPLCLFEVFGYDVKNNLTIKQKTWDLPVELPFVASF